MKIVPLLLVVLATLGLAGPSLAGDAPGDAAALARFQAAHGAGGAVIQHLDLTRVFQTRTPWALVAVQGPKVKDVYGDDGAPGMIALCLAHEAALDCAGPKFPSAGGQIAATPNWDKDIDNHHQLSAMIVAPQPGIARPLLLLTTASLPSGDGDRLLSMFVLAYDKTTDRFVALFANGTPSNNNQQTRLIEQGPLAGDIIVDEPTPTAPFGYFITVYRAAPGGAYAPVLRYRSRTGYGDGNPLAVIDSEMPDILKRLGLWKTGEPLPKPAVMPAACHRLEMRAGVEWCC